MEIGTDESARELYWFAIGARSGAENPSIDILDIDNFRLRWGTVILAGGDPEQNRTVYFGNNKRFEGRPAMFVSALHSFDGSYRDTTESRFTLTNDNTSPSEREHSWLAMGVRAGGTVDSKSSYPLANVWYQSMTLTIDSLSHARIGSSTIWWIEQMSGPLQANWVNFEEQPFTDFAAAFASGEHSDDEFVKNVQKDRYQFGTENLAGQRASDVLEASSRAEQRAVSTFTIGH